MSNGKKVIHLRLPESVINTIAHTAVDRNKRAGTLMADLIIQYAERIEARRELEQRAELGE